MLAGHGSHRLESYIKSRFNTFQRLLLEKEKGGASIRNLRFTGSAIVDMGLVAKGAAEIFWEVGPHAWDYAAGVVLVLESGGAVFDGAGWWGSSIPENERSPQPLNIWKRKILAIRHIPDLPGKPGSGREIQKQLAADVLNLVEDTFYEPDAREQLQAYLDTAVALAKEVGPVFKDGFWRTGQFAAGDDFAATNKMDDETDCVTAVDCHIEKVTFSRLREIYPEHKFVGEETTAEIGNEYKVTDDPTWVVDPVDGTNNFVHHFPYTGISIGLTVNKEPALGVIYLPILDELYTAAKGLGAQLNGQSLPLFHPPALTTPTALSQCSMLSGPGVRRSESYIKPHWNTFQRLLLEKEKGGASVRNLRFTGSAASDLALVAKGVAEIYWEVGPQAWDYAAGAILVLESGGAVFDGAGWWGSNIPEDEKSLQPLNIWKRKILAIRHIPDLPGKPGSGREIQKQLAADVLNLVEDTFYEPDGSH
ncbi:hypothetical protein H4R20_003697 [Coemansia guatemalensis]|uniref:inositol-phosphate phosphatase n=1 Tax=Coemansia guatemalensis TaxID=2761395 RepID=A0A9W8HTA2_9FUNG|nr:hypothetical protein H4R20_003697 [Coemansia guatemalensis]